MKNITDEQHEEYMAKMVVINAAYKAAEASEESWYAYGMARMAAFNEMVACV